MLWKTKKARRKRVLKMTMMRVSRPWIPLVGLGKVLAGVGTLGWLLDAESVEESWSAFLAFLLDEVGVAEAAATAVLVPLVWPFVASTADTSTFASSSTTSGSMGSTYVSSKVDTAIAAATHTTGVSVSINRTITPAK